MGFSSYKNYEKMHNIAALPIELYKPKQVENSIL